MDRRVVDDPEYARGARLLHETLGGAARRVCERAALALLTPACLVAGVADIGLAYLRQKGFTPRFVHVTRLDTTAVEGVWRHQRPAFQPDRWDVAVRLFTAGPALVVMAIREPADGLAASELLTSMKGPSDPARCATTTLRAHLGAANKLNNLVHTSDGPREVIRELAALLDDGGLRAAWLACAGTESHLPTATVERICRHARRRDGVSLAHVAVRLRRRLLTRLSLAARAVPRRTATNLLVRETRALRGIPPTRPREALVRHRATFGTAAGAWPHAAVPARADPLTLAWRIVEAELFDRAGPPWRMWSALEDAGVRPGSWDWLVLASEHMSRYGRV